uniref:Ig-like domain-containing protein n=1 Tax=Nothobranchius kadleci TaxID=1051664 RepID=A0A1A8DVZ7_NOTKA
MHADSVLLACSLVMVLRREVEAVSLVPSVPDRVKALVDSCVVIPCSFTPAAPDPLQGPKKRVDVRLRFRDGSHLFPLRSTAFNSESRDQVSRNFQGRTSLFGRISDGDCSVQIEGVRAGDPKVFEVALKKEDVLLWGKPRSINLDIIVYNVTRDMRVRCSAQNAIGRGESQPTALNVQYKPTIVQLSSSCVVGASEVLCRCSVDSNPKSAVTWSVNETAPRQDYNMSTTSESGMLTASLRGRMDKPLRVMCFAFNGLGNDSLVLLQGDEGSETAALIWIISPATLVGLLIFLLALLGFCCRKKAKKRVLSRTTAVYPMGLGIYQESMPLYINCTEVTHVYTNGSYQLVYQNCTPLFVHNEQLRPMGRRGGERKRGREDGRVDRQGGVGVRATREVQGADPETGIYLEVL